MTADLDSLLDWLKDAVAEPVPAKLVPGASLLERHRLGALGGVVRDLVPSAARAAWPADVVEWLETGPVVPSRVVAAVGQAIASNPDETLAALYGNLVSGASRRALGTFFTPPPEVEMMLDMWERSEEAPSTVVDVGAGVGVFTASAAERWPNAAIFGVDINPVTLGLLALRVWVSNLALVTGPNSSPGIRLIRDDFTIWVREVLRETNAPRLILGNPPYTRSQLLSTEDRVRLGLAAEGLCGKRASLSTLISAISLCHIDASDGLCLLLPAQWLESRYAAPLRGYLAGLVRRRIELRLVESKLFPDAQVDAVALLIGREQANEQGFLVGNWPAGIASPVDRATLVGTPWRSLFNPQSPNAPGLGQATSSVIPGLKLSDFCVVRRGTATGANGFFALSDEDVAQNQLPKTRLLKLVRRLNGYPDIIDDQAFNSVSSSEKRWLLYVKHVHRTEGSRVDRYLKAAEEAGINMRYLCRTRRPEWYDLTHDLVIPDIIVGAMTRGRFRFVENTAKAVITNNLYGWCWHAEVSTASRAAIINWLLSEAGQRTVLAAARSQGDGLHKLEPSALANVLIPASIIPPPLELIANSEPPGSDEGSDPLSVLPVSRLGGAG